MHFWSPAEDSPKPGWAEVVVQGTIPEEQAYALNKLAEDW